MSGSLRIWIFVLVTTTFLAGLASGILLGLEIAPEPVARGPFADYAELLEQRFDLSPERTRGLHTVLDQYQRQIENLKNRNAAALEPEFARLGLTFRTVVRDTVLPPDRRDEFQRLSAGIVETPH